ncbi:MAG: hypothetical protein ABI895_13855 [Deltaproteobacteria bacterium]
MLDAEFSEVTAQVQRWVDRGFYSGAGLIIGGGEQIRRSAGDDRA